MRVLYLHKWLARTLDCGDPANRLHTIPGARDLLLHYEWELAMVQTNGWLLEALVWCTHPSWWQPYGGLFPAGYGTCLYSDSRTIVGSLGNWDANFALLVNHIRGFNAASDWRATGNLPWVFAHLVDITSTERNIPWLACLYHSHTLLASSKKETLLWQGVCVWNIWIDVKLLLPNLGFAGEWWAMRKSPLNEDASSFAVIWRRDAFVTYLLFSRTWQAAKPRTTKLNLYFTVVAIWYLFSVINMAILFNFGVWFRLRVTISEDLHRLREVLPGDLL